jgi:hypothetical protein
MFNSYPVWKVDFGETPNSEELNRAKANDYTVLAEYEEPEVSGGRADNRPQLQAAPDQVCKEKATLVVYTLDRLARNVDDARAISKWLEKAGANLAILQMAWTRRRPTASCFSPSSPRSRSFIARTSPSAQVRRCCGTRRTAGG